MLKLGPGLVVVAVIGFGLCPASGQGTFTYTFSGDNSPLNVWAIFQASDQAVASGLLTTDNITGGYMLQAGNHWPLFYVRFPVNAVTGQPSGTSTFNTHIAGSFNYDEIDLYGGVSGDPDTMVVYWPWVGDPSDYSGTSGTWSMTYSVPEAHSFRIVGFGLIWFYHQLRFRHKGPVGRRPRE